MLSHVVQMLRHWVDVSSEIQLRVGPRLHADSLPARQTSTRS